MSDSIADTELNSVSTPETESEPKGNGQEVPENTSSSWLDKLLADAPEDDGSYQTHALNFDRSESTSKIIRGVEGIAGNLNKAIILIGIGLLEKFNENMSEGSEEPEENPESEEDTLVPGELEE